MRICDMGEIGLIKRLAGKIRLDKSVVKGIGDDTAVIRWTKDKYLLFTCDMLVEDVHFWFRGAKPLRETKFLKKATAFQIGWKALARNISDIAAMGGVPRYAVVSLGIAPSLSVKFADGISDGILTLARKFGINIVGGDTVRSKKLVIDISLIGEVEKRNLTLRSGAKKGDVILVTGSIGGSIKGKHLNFMPRLNEARRLVKEFKVNSMIDVSDGLVLDLWRILDASRVGAMVYEQLIPVSKNAVSFNKAITGGEDFELLFTMRAKEATRLLKGRHNGTPIRFIGEVTGMKGGYILVRNNGRGERLKPKGYHHF